MKKPSAPICPKCKDPMFLGLNWDCDCYKRNYQSVIKFELSEKDKLGSDDIITAPKITMSRPDETIEIVMVYCIPGTMDQNIGASNTLFRDCVLDSTPSTIPSYIKEFFTFNKKYTSPWGINNLRPQRIIRKDAKILDRGIY